jgi:hypothetical protein
LAKFGASSRLARSRREGRNRRFAVMPELSWEASGGSRAGSAHV